MKKVLVFETVRHHNVEEPGLYLRRYIEDEKDIHPTVLKLLRETIENDTFHTIPNEEWDRVSNDLLSFWRQEIDNIELPFTTYDEDDSDYEFLIFCEREDDGKTNMLYCPDSEMAKYENRWFEFYIIDDKKVQKIRNKYENKTREELIDELVLNNL